MPRPPGTQPATTGDHSDDTWATPSAVSEAARSLAERDAKSAAQWAQRAKKSDPEAGRGDYERWAAEHRASHNAYLAIAAKHKAN